MKKTRAEGRRVIVRDERWEVLGGSNEELRRTVVVNENDRTYKMCEASDPVTADQIARLPTLLDKAEDLLWKLRNVVVPEEASDAWLTLSTLVLYYRKGSDLHGSDTSPSEYLKDVIELAKERG